MALEYFPSRRVDVDARVRERRDDGLVNGLGLAGRRAIDGIEAVGGTTGHCSSESVKGFAVLGFNLSVWNCPIQAQSD